MYKARLLPAQLARLVVRPSGLIRLRCAFWALSALGAPVFAAVPVAESASAGGAEEPAAESPQPAPAQVNVYGGAQARSRQPLVTVAEPADGASLVQLFHQIQVLQRELQILRGMVEDQGFLIDRLARDQNGQYADLDRRILALRGGVAEMPLRQAGADAGLPSATASPARRQAPVSTGAATAEAGAEQQAFAAALDLMRSKAFDESAAALQQMIADHPNGQYTANGYYWLGEIHLQAQRTEQARQHFVQVVSLYPEHAKVPVALYKLGVALHQLGDQERALDYLLRVQAEYPDSAAAGLAKTYAAESQ